MAGSVSFVLGLLPLRAISQEKNPQANGHVPYPTPSSSRDLHVHIPAWYTCIRRRGSPPQPVTYLSDVLRRASMAFFLARLHKVRELGANAVVPNQ